MYDLVDKVAIVTGAGRKGGIGAAIAMRLAREGANVVIGDICAPVADLPNPGTGQWEELVAVAEEIESLGVRSLPVRVDVTDASLVEAMVAQTAEDFGCLDILVNNAGAIVGPSPVIQMAEESWRKTLEINATGTFLCCKAALPTMIAGGRGGRIISISSIAAKAPKPYMAAYAASKAAILALTRSLAQEVAESGINVNCVAPGLGATGFHPASGFSTDYLEMIQKMKAAGKTTTPEDMGNTVAFLVSDVSIRITGQCLRVSGTM